MKCAEMHAKNAKMIWKLFAEKIHVQFVKKEVQGEIRDKWQFVGFIKILEMKIQM